MKRIFHLPFWGIALIVALSSCSKNEVVLIQDEVDYALSCTIIKLMPGESAILSVINTKTMAKVDAQVIWSTSNDDIATVDNGNITGRNIGNAIICAKIGGVTLCCDVNVMAGKRLIKEVTLTGGNFSFFYDNQSRLREINGENMAENNPGYKNKIKAFIEYLEDGKATLVLEEMVEKNGEEVGGTRQEYELIFNASGKPICAKNVFNESYSTNITYNSSAVITRKGYVTESYESGQIELVKHNLFYEYSTDGNLKSIQDGNDTLYEYTYDTVTAPVYVNYFQSSAFDFGFIDFVLNMVIGFPEGQLVSSETVGAGTEYYSYKFDKDGYVTKIEADFIPEAGFPDHKYLISKDYFISYVNAGDTSYERKDPYVYQGMGGKTYVYTECYEGDNDSWYLTFLDASRFYFIEDEINFQDVICGTYSRNGSEILMKLSGSDDITIGTVSGNTIQTEGGYFGGLRMTITDNLIL